MGILNSILILGIIGALGALLLYIVARKFAVHEDPLIAKVEAILPGANCGGCGKNGCHDFACACVEAGNLDSLKCPVTGETGMKAIADLLGCVASGTDANVAVVHCAGTVDTKTPLGAKYVGPSVCSIMNMGAGDYACVKSCLGCGDCTRVCKFEAIKMIDGRCTPVVDTDACTGCGNCEAACPRQIISIIPAGRNNRRVWIACSNCQKGAITRKQCTVGCIGCGLCSRTCPFGAIAITNNLAHIDYAKCKACGKCVAVCPTKAINSVNIKIIKKDESSDI